MNSRGRNTDRLARICPSPLDLGTTYVGAVVEGTIRIAPPSASEFLRLDSRNRAGRSALEFERTGGLRGDCWKFRVATTRPMQLAARATFSTELGEAGVNVAMKVKRGIAPGGAVLFCHSPFNSGSGFPCYGNLNVMTRELRVQVNATDVLPADLSPFHVVVLFGGGLVSFSARNRARVRRFLESGGRVVVLANHFYRHTVTGCNQLVEPHGISIADREYKEVLCDERHIESHVATQSVTRLRWFRPSPMTTKGTARILVRNPQVQNEGFLACGGPHANLFVVGTSLISSLLCEGWPFENAELFANLLRTAS